MAIQTQNPATGEVLKTFTPHSDAHVDAAIARAYAAQKEIRDVPFKARSAALNKMAYILETEAEELA